MKLYYYRDPIGNFGDDLNLWLWPQLVPGLFDEDDGRLFIGIGTLLNHRVPLQPSKVVLGAGVGYGRPPVVDERWKIYCVRGPLSAMALGLDGRFAATDPAILVRTLDLQEEPKRHAIAFMPHHKSVKRANWKVLCKVTGVHFIDPRASFLRVLRDIKRSKLIVTEAMHGAIVADALRIPWVPVRLYGAIDAFKWQDWCRSLALEYEPLMPEPLLDAGRGIQSKVRRRVEPARVIAGLRRWVRDRDPLLSSDACIGAATERLLEEVERLRRDVDYARSKGTDADDPLLNNG